MKHQKGFISLVASAVVMIGLIIVAGGGYVLYTDKQRELTFRETIKNLPPPAALVEEETPVETTTPPVTPVTPPKTEPAKTVVVKASVPAQTSVKLNCDNNWSCLISAATECKAATGIMTKTNVQSPFFPDLLQSGQTMFEIKKSGNSCILVYSLLAQSVTLKESGRQEMLSQGITHAEIESELQSMNDSFKTVLGLPSTCISNASTISSYLIDQQSNSIGTGEISFSTSSGQNTITTTSGQKLTCTMIQSQT